MPAFITSAAPPSFLGRTPPRSLRSPRRAVAPSRRAAATTAKLDALLFDCDGVLADTERDAHRVAFNLAFAERGLPDEWGEAQYGHLLETGGGKERMTAYWGAAPPSWPSAVADDPSAQAALVRDLHARKTALFMSLVDSGAVPLRPGVQRLVAEARRAGVTVAVCSTSNERAVQRIVDQLGSDADGIQVFAGDVVPKKKPAPDVYLLAADRLRLDPANVCVIEDSFIGVAAARAAGMPCVVTKSTYTKDEDFAQAQLVLESLEDPFTTLQDLTNMVEALRNAAVQ